MWHYIRSIDTGRMQEKRSAMFVIKLRNVLSMIYIVIIDPSRLVS